MKKLYTLVCMSLIAASAMAEVITINQVNNTFSPQMVNANIGDVIHWVWSSGTHNTTSAVVPAGAASWAAPLTMAEPTFDYTITVAGTYAYSCTFHQLSGMAGAITVAAATTVEPIIASAPEFTAGVDNSTNTLYVNIENFNPSHSVLKMIDITGRMVEELMNTELASGSQSFRFNVASHSRGMYFLRLEQGGRVVTRKVMLN